MDDILSTIFEAFDTESPSPKEKAALEAAEAPLKKAEEKLSWEEFDQLWNAVLAVGTADVEASFVRGLRVGARLMLEALGRGD